MSIARNINWSLPAYLRNALRSPIATDRLGALDGLDHLYRIGNDTVRACVRDEIQRLTDDDSRMVSSAAVERLRSLLPRTAGVSEPEAAKAPESPAARVTTPPTQQPGLFVPAVVPAQQPDATFLTAEPPPRPAIELHPLPSATTQTEASNGKSRSKPTARQRRVSKPPRWGFVFGTRRICPRELNYLLFRSLAGCGARVLSFLIDVVLPSIVSVPAWIYVAFTNHDEELIVPRVLVLVAFAVWNSGYRQGTSGQSLGRRVTKTKLVKIETGEPIRFGMALLRLICLTVTLGIGYLWPLWDSRRQTVADKIVKAVVVRS